MKRRQWRRFAVSAELRYVLFRFTVTRLILTISASFSPVMPLSAGLMSIPRFTVVLFPLFITFAKLGKKDHAGQGMTVSLALLQGCLMVFWSRGSYLII